LIFLYGFGSQQMPVFILFLLSLGNTIPVCLKVQTGLGRKKFTPARQCSGHKILMANVRVAVLRFGVWIPAGRRGTGTHESRGADIKIFINLLCRAAASRNSNTLA
jgi:hypothetical protein